MHGKVFVTSRAHRLGLACIALLSLTACESSDFECIAELGDVRMAASVVHRDDRIDAEIKLWAEQSNGVEIPIEICPDDDDTLSVAGRDATEVTTPTQTIYAVELPEAKRRYRVELYRGRANDRATIEITAPADFALSPVAAEISRAAPPPLEWGPAMVDGTIELRVERDELTCLERDQQTVPDTGRFALTAPWPRPTATMPDEATCAAEVSLTRRSDRAEIDNLRAGTTGSAFIQRKARFLSTP